MAILVSKWRPPGGGAEECYVLGEAQQSGSFADQVEQLFGEYGDALHQAGHNPSSLVTATIFLSDAANQEQCLRLSAQFAALTAGGGAVTIVQQAPARCKIGLLAYHVRRAGESRAPFRLAGTKGQAMGLAVTTESYRFIYMKNLLSVRGTSAAEQAEALLGIAGGGVRSNGIELADVVRTWLYIHDVDTHYGAVSAARNRVFERFGISTATGFPASTGIEARGADHRDLLLLDAVAIHGLRPGQSRPMQAPGHMNPTVDYGVTFERGRAVVFGDRRHLYVSGTASIDSQGQIVHAGDVARQTERAAANVGALLADSGASLDHLLYVIVYVRDLADAGAVEAAMAAGPLARTPRLLVRGAVCRPGWLMELEGVAVDGRGDGHFAAF